MQELHERWAPNIVTALGRFGGRTVGVVANNPLRLGGCLDSLSAEKASRFVRLCDALGVPLIVARRRAGLPARRRPGVGRRRTPRRQAAARVRRVRRTPGHPDHPQDLRRRLHRDELPRPRRDQGVRLAGRRGGGDGRRWRRSASCTAASWPRSRRRSAPRSRPSWPPSTSGSPAASTRRSEIGVVDEVVEPAAPAARSPARSTTASRPTAYAAASTATSRSDVTPSRRNAPFGGRWSSCDPRGGVMRSSSRPPTRWRSRALAAVIAGSRDRVPASAGHHGSTDTSVPRRRSAARAATTTATTTS